MNVQHFSSSESLFQCKEPLVDPKVSEFNSWRGRGMAIGRFFQKIAILPLAFLAKLFRTSVAILGLGFAFSLLILTFGYEGGIRGFFLKKILCLATEIADWVLWPLAVVYCLGRLLLAATVHPALYFGV
jgi:hypothetical protein